MAANNGGGIKDVVSDPFHKIDNAPDLPFRYNALKLGRVCLRFVPKSVID